MEKVLAGITAAPPRDVHNSSRSQTPERFGYHTQRAPWYQGQGNPTQTEEWQAQEHEERPPVPNFREQLIKRIHAVQPQKKHPNFGMIWSRVKPMGREQKIHVEDKVSKELNLGGSND